MKDDAVFLKHILDAIGAIEEYLNGVEYGDFIRRGLVRDGVIRQLEIIGEATKRLSPELRNGHPQTPWQDLAGMRDKLIHHYFGVDVDAVWDAAKNDMPKLKKDVKLILNKIESFD